MIELDQHIRPSTVTLALVDYGYNSTPIAGGPIIRTNRPGNRFKVSMQFPPFKAASDGRKLIADLIKAKTSGLRLRWEQGFDVRSPGTPVINGAGQLGTSLIVSGLTPHVTIPRGVFFSFEQSGRSYLHCVVSDVTADESGDATLVIEPELRVSTVDATALNFSAPVIDGVVEGDEFNWQLSLSYNIDLNVTLMERY